MMIAEIKKGTVLYLCKLLFYKPYKFKDIKILKELF